MPDLDGAQDLYWQAGAERELVNAPPGFVAQIPDPSSCVVQRGGGCLVEWIHSV